MKQGTEKQGNGRKQADSSRDGPSRPGQSRRRESCKGTFPGILQGFTSSAGFRGQHTERLSLWWYRTSRKTGLCPVNP